jgi:hypothetical protein
MGKIFWTLPLINATVKRESGKELRHEAVPSQSCPLRVGLFSLTHTPPFYILNPPGLKDYYFWTS